MSSRLRFAGVAGSLGCLLLLACSSTTNIASGTGGGDGQGGDDSTGGRGDSGGSDSSGGAEASGGDDASGGADGSGGADSTGGSQGGGGAAAFEPSVGDPPDARLNAEYSHQLVAEGVTSFELLGGAPAGLTLSDTGLLSGRPTQHGDFTLEIEVSDGERTAVIELAFHVIRRPFLAFRVQTGGVEGPGQAMVYLKNAFRSTNPSAVLPTAEDFTDVQHFAFSPDGTRFAFRADDDEDGVYRLFLMDVSGDTPGTATPVAGLDSVVDFAWKPNGAELVALTRDGATSEHSLRAVDVGATPPAVDDVALDLGTSAPTSLQYVTGAHVVWIRGSAVEYVARSGSDWTAPQSLTYTGTGPSIMLLRNGGRLLISATAGCGGGGCATAYALYDFTDDELPKLNYPSRFEFDDSFTVGVDCGGAGPVARIIDTTALDVADFELTALPGGVCGTARITRDGRTVVYATATGVRRQRLDGQDLDGPDELAPGTYSAPGGFDRAGFTLSGRWYWWTTSTGELWALEVAADPLPEPVLVSGEQVALSGYDAITVAPTVDQLAFVSDPTTASVDEVGLVDLMADPPPEDPRRVSTMATGSVVAWSFEPSFSADSSFVAYAFDAGPDNGTELHLVDLRDPVGVGKNPLRNYSPYCASGDCSSAWGLLVAPSGIGTRAFAWQP